MMRTSVLRPPARLVFMHVAVNPITPANTFPFYFQVVCPKNAVVFVRGLKVGVENREEVQIRGNNPVFVGGVLYQRSRVLT